MYLSSRVVASPLSRDMGYLVQVGCVFLSMVVQQLVVILVLWQEKMKTRLSTPPWAFNVVNCISV